ncbi:MAG: hypothetical protein PHR57_03105 [Patescibacteria group bacterium]|jgi:hypothetical protein|nr:hypothetical protein [Patescibacteria group bacterium]
MKKLLIVAIFLIVTFFTVQVKASVLNEFIPTELQNIDLEMNYTDFKLLYPEAKNIGNSSETFCILEISHDEIWNGCILIFKDEKLKYIAVLRQKSDDVIDANQYFNIEQKILPILKKLIKVFGRTIIKKINKKKDNLTISHEPIIIWESKKTKICLGYTPPQFISKVQNPNIILAVIAEGEDFSSYFQELHNPENSQITFDEMLNTSIKDVLYGSIEVKIK